MANNKWCKTLQEKLDDEVYYYSTNLKSIEADIQNYKILKEELDKLKSEFEKLKVTDDMIDEWHIPPTSDMF